MVKKNSNGEGGEETMVGRVELTNMEFYAYHGCFKEEQLIGNWFIVNFSASYNMFEAAVSDDLTAALNYQEVYNLIEEEVALRSNLIESVAYRILKRVGQQFPQVLDATVELSKMGPPIGGRVEASKVILTREFS